MASPVAQIREIVNEHESIHASMSEPCNCMERIAFVMGVAFPRGIESVMINDSDYIVEDDDVASIDGVVIDE